MRVVVWAMLHAHRPGGVKLLVAKLPFQNIDRLLDRLLVKRVDGPGLLLQRHQMAGKKTTKSRALLATEQAGSGHCNRLASPYVIGVALSSKSGGGASWDGFQHRMAAPCFLRIRAADRPWCFFMNLAAIHGLVSRSRFLRGAIAFLALSPRGYPPSDVPEGDAAYGWQVNIDDAAALLDHLEIPSAHFIGLSMGAYSGLMLAIQRPGQVQSLVAASGGSGAWAESRDAFIAACHRLADLAVAQAHMPADQMAYGPSRIQLREKNRAAWDEFTAILAEHPGVGSGLTQMGQAARPKSC